MLFRSQINGKLRARFNVAYDLDIEDVKKLAVINPNVAKHLEGLTVKKVVVIPNKLVNIVAS